MSTVAIPEWTPLGILPPMDSQNPTAPQRSPYSISMLDLVMRFATSPARHQILSGFVHYRAALHAIGLVSGMQWLDGSFMEHIELLEQRAPRDIDVVTFLHSPPGFAPGPDNTSVLDHDEAKARFHVDSYFVELDKLPARTIVSLSTYWYSLWSHRRNATWKGFLQVDLEPATDLLARQWLDRYDSLHP
ncbi:DUF6932 family protein [Rhizobacter sp. P5_C2]